MARTPAPDYEMFASIEKIDEEKRQVFGYATTEIKDRQGETVTKAAVEAALPAYMLWKNVREMHQPSAVGKAIEAQMHDKGLWFGAQVVDDRAWDKVKKGVYTGFSIGGKVTSRDALDKSIITGLDLSEISLVDRPACPEAVFMLVKRAADGMKLEPVQKWDCGCPDHQHIAKVEASLCMAEQQEELTKNEVVIGEDGLFKYMPPETVQDPAPVVEATDGLIKYNQNHAPSGGPDGGQFSSGGGGGGGKSPPDYSKDKITYDQGKLEGINAFFHGDGGHTPAETKALAEVRASNAKVLAARNARANASVMGYFDPSKGALAPGSYREVRGGFQPGMKVKDATGKEHVVASTSRGKVTTTTGTEHTPYDLEVVTKSGDELPLALGECLDDGTVIFKRAGGTMTPRSITGSKFAGHGKSVDEAQALAKEHVDHAVKARNTQAKFTKLAAESKQAGNMLGAVAHSKLASSHGKLASHHEKVASDLADLAASHVDWTPTLTKSEELKDRAAALRSRQLAAA